MAITYLEVITRALREINVINEVQSASAEQGTQALQKLNSLMEAWKESSKDVGYFEQTSTTDTCPIPDYAEAAVIYSLAVILAPQYGTAVSGELAAMQSHFTKALTRKIIVEGLDNVDMTHLPRGTGWWGNRYNITTDS